MISVAEKFKSIGKVTSNLNSSSSIFGSAGSLASSIENTRQYKVSFYPIIGEAQPEVTMGITSCLAYLLEQYSNFTVYRVFAKIDDNESDEELNIKDSQFSIEDWEFTGLDDSVIIFGSLLNTQQGLNLTITIDQTLLADAESIKLNYQTNELHKLVNLLPTIAQDISESIAADNSEELIVTYNDLTESTDALSELLTGVFYWNLDLYLHLWNVEWDDEEVEEQIEELLALCDRMNHPFAIWCTSMVAKQVMQVGLDAVGEIVVPLIETISAKDAQGNLSVVLLSQGLLNLGYIDDAVRLVEQHTLDDLSDTLVWNTLIDIYVEAGQHAKAIDANQRAIENGIQDPVIFWRYARLLMLAESNDWFVEELVLIDPDEVDDDQQMAAEIIVAIETILQSSPQNIVALQTLLPYLINNDSTDVWIRFEQLVNTDTSGISLRNAIELLYEFDDLAPAFSILEEDAKRYPDRPESYLNLAQLSILDEDGELALTHLEKCKNLTTDDAIQLEIQKMTLSATHLDFDQIYSEILTVLSANRSVSENNVEFLEEAIEIAPKFGNLYVTLARAYLGWKDTDTALQVLLDANEVVGPHPDIIRMLSQILWSKGEQEVAFKYINEGIKQFPNYVPLLTQVAGYLIDNKQLEDSKPFIERAEIIAPSHPELWKLRRRIADTLSN